jgi:hypothetical protein
MIEADDQLLTAVVKGDAQAYRAANEMKARDLLNLYVAYLRSAAAEWKAAQKSKRHGK